MSFKKNIAEIPVEVAWSSGDLETKDSLLK